MLGTTSNRCAVKERPAPCETETPEPSLVRCRIKLPRDPRSTPIPPDFPRWRRQCGGGLNRRIGNRLRKLSAAAEVRKQVSGFAPLLVSRLDRRHPRNRRTIITTPAGGEPTPKRWYGGPVNPPRRIGERGESKTELGPCSSSLRCTACTMDHACIRAAEQRRNIPTARLIALGDEPKIGSPNCDLGVSGFRGCCIRRHDYRPLAPRRDRSGPIARPID